MVLFRTNIRNSSSFYSFTWTNSEYLWNTRFIVVKGAVYNLLVMLWVCLIDIFSGNNICISVLCTEEQRFIGGCLISIFKFRIFKLVVYMLVVYYYIYLYLIFIYLLCFRNAVSIHQIMDLSLQMRLDGVLLHLTLRVSWGWMCPKFLVLLFMGPPFFVCLYIYKFFNTWELETF